MSKNQWTVIAASLTICLQAGCQGPGRFSRQQYARMEADPFLAAEADLEKARDAAPEAMTASAIDAPTEHSGLGTRRSESGDANRPSGSVKDSPRRSPVRTGAVASAASVVPDFGTSLAQNSPVQAAAAASDGFDKFLRENSKKVVQAGATFHEHVNESAPLAHQKVKQADYLFPPVFPAPHQTVEIEDPVTDDDAAETNPFAEMDAFSGGSSASSGKDPSWPPGDFKFP